MINYIDYYFEASKEQDVLVKQADGMEQQILKNGSQAYNKAKSEIINALKGNLNAFGAKMSTGLFYIPIGKIAYGVNKSLKNKLKAEAESKKPSDAVTSKMEFEVIEQYDPYDAIPPIEVYNLISSNINRLKSKTFWINSNKLDYEKIDFWKPLEEQGSTNGLGYAGPYNDSETFAKEIIKICKQHLNKMLEVSIPLRNGPPQKIKCFYGNLKDLIKTYGK